MEFRALPDQVGKPAREVSSACGAAWRSLTLEEKEVSPSLPSGLRLPAIDSGNLEIQECSLRVTHRLEKYLTP